MNEKNRPIFRWPDRQLLLFFIFAVVAVSTEFAVIYGITNRWASDAPNTHQWYTAWEVTVPFWPVFILPYFSIYFMLLLSVFVLDFFEMRVFTKTVAAAIALGGLVFWLFPCSSGFARDNQPAEFTTLYRLLYSLDRPHNLVPSLHITLSAISALAMSRGRRRSMQIFLAAWFSAIVASVLLVHQHHLLDIITGLSLAVFCSRYFFAGQKTTA